MTAHPSPEAIRARLYREQRAAAPVPPDVQALLDRGRQERALLVKKRKALWALGHIEAAAAAKLVKVQRTKSPAVRARLLGDLADWIIERRETLESIVGHKPIKKRPRRVPAWVPDDLAAVYLDPMVSEFEAARRVRAMKREAA